MSSSLELVGFRLAGYPLVVEAGLVGQMQAPHAQALASALANRQRLCAYLGLPAEAPAGRWHSLLLRSAAGPLACALDEPIELFSASLEQLLPLPPLVRDCQRLPAVRAVLQRPEGLCLVLDPARLRL
ncbi:MAG: hypothetical protein HQL47_12230 [Gammaproteobacteria bacterium]|nr:hypothetical protein [Gammaproteobacteria bacterium]